MRWCSGFVDSGRSSTRRSLRRTKRLSVTSSSKRATTHVVIVGDGLRLHRDDGPGAKPQPVHAVAVNLEKVVRRRAEERARAAREPRGDAPFGEDGLARGDGTGDHHGQVLAEQPDVARGAGLQFHPTLASSMPSRCESTVDT